MFGIERLGRVLNPDPCSQSFAVLSLSRSHWGTLGWEEECSWLSNSIDVAKAGVPSLWLETRLGVQWPFHNGSKITVMK